MAESGSALRTGCFSREKLGFIYRLNPWSWVAAVFALHAAGSVAVVRLFELDYSKVAAPICIVALGAILALAFRWFDRFMEVGEWKWWLPVAVYALFIFALSSTSYKPSAAPCTTKIFHVAEYFVLGVLLCRVWWSSTLSLGVAPLTIRVLAAGILFAASDEIHQSFVPGRTPTVSDVILDTSALCLGLLLVVAIRYAGLRAAKSCEVAA